MLSAIVITKNESEMIGDCLISLEFCDEKIVVDTGNTDDTNEISQRFGSKIIKSHGSDYSQFRNDGLKAARGEWVLYIDADERVTPQLRQEILKVISKANTVSAFTLPRENIYLGKKMKYGGWGNDSVTRLFKRSDLKYWTNPLHEKPIFSGECHMLTQSIIHFSHRDLESMLNKTLVFTAYEANLRLIANHPPMVWWRFIRVMATEFWYRFIKLQAFRDGVEGFIDGMFQVFNTFIIYARLWEIQIEKSRNS
jgi:glycosyltransferase involved in cell wall biosynthesis